MTQGLLGAVVAQTGFRQRIGRDATLVAAAAAYSPDLDMFAPRIYRMFGADGPLLGLTTHRALTHSLLMVPVIALLFAGPWYWARKGLLRRGRPRIGPNGPDPPEMRPPAGFGLLYLCCFVAVLSHPLLDWCTSYGTQLLAPLTKARFAVHTVGIVDFIYTPLLILTLTGCWLARFKGKRSGLRRSVAIGAAGLVLSTGYLSAGWVLRGRAVDRALAFHEPDEVVSAEAYPMIGTIFLWRTVIETPDAWITSRVHHLSGDATLRHTVSPKVDDSPLISASRQTEIHEVYDWFAGGHLRAAVETDGADTLVLFHDMRYALRPESDQSLWPLVFRYSPDGELLSARRDHQRRNEGTGSFLATLWSDIWDF